MSETTVTLLGIGLQTAIFLFGGVVMVVRNDTSLKGFQKELAKMQQELQALAAVITQQAVQAERLNEQSRRMTLLEERIERMRRGIGWEQDHGAKTVDREY